MGKKANQDIRNGASNSCIQTFRFLVSNQLLCTRYFYWQNNSPIFQGMHVQPCFCKKGRKSWPLFRSENVFFSCGRGKFPKSVFHRCYIKVFLKKTRQFISKYIKSFLMYLATFWTPIIYLQDSLGSSKPLNMH